MDNESKTSLVGCAVGGGIVLIVIVVEVIIRWLLSPTGWNF